MGINDSSDSKLDLDADSALPQPEGLFDRCCLLWHGLA